MRYAVFGDTGGHYLPLYKALCALGLEESTGKLPHELTIIHMGDLVHKGPGSADIIEMVNYVREASPGQWIQLMGNHEAFYLGGPDFVQPRDIISDTAQDTLRQWHDERFLRLGYAIVGDMSLQSPLGNYPLTGSTLFTHAGLEPRFLEDKLHNATIADIPDALWEEEKSVLNDAGDILLGKTPPTLPVSPIWALGTTEVWQRWRREGGMPFNQVVGHVYPYTYERERWFASSPDVDFISKATIFPSLHSTIVPSGNRFLYFADPGHSSTYSTQQQPYTIITA